MSVSKESLLQLAVHTPRTTIRPTCESDFDAFLSWPDYAWPDQCYNMRFDQHADNPWWQRITDPHRVHFSIVCKQTSRVIGIHTFVNIDWQAATVGTMGIRIDPRRCGQGLGTETLRPLVCAIADAGIKSIQLDVAAFNTRAIHCYSQVGFRLSHTTWQAWKHIDYQANDPRWVFAKKHIKQDSDTCLVRFAWMVFDDC